MNFFIKELLGVNDSTFIGIKKERFRSFLVSSGATMFLLAKLIPQRQGYILQERRRGGRGPRKDWRCGWCIPPPQRWWPSSFLSSPLCLLLWVVNPRKEDIRRWGNCRCSVPCLPQSLSVRSRCQSASGIYRSHRKNLVCLNFSIILLRFSQSWILDCYKECTLGFI